MDTRRSFAGTGSGRCLGHVLESSLPPYPVQRSPIASARRQHQQEPRQGRNRRAATGCIVRSIAAGFSSAGASGMVGLRRGPTPDRPTGANSSRRNPRKVLMQNRRSATFAPGTARVQLLGRLCKTRIETAAGICPVPGASWLCQAQPHHPWITPSASPTERLTFGVAPRQDEAPAGGGRNPLTPPLRAPAGHALATRFPTSPRSTASAPAPGTSGRGPRLLKHASSAGQGRRRA